MNITLNLNITGDVSPDALRALLTVAAEYATVAPQVPTGRAASPTPPRERGPNVRAYMEAMDRQRAAQNLPALIRFRKGEGMQAMDDETAALVMLAALNAGGATYAKPEDEPPMDYAEGDDMEGGDGADLY